MPSCRFLDSLPIELLHILFSYFAAYEIIHSFSNVSDYANAALHSYLAYQWNFQSIRKSHFHLICLHIRPEQVQSLVLSDDDDTPGQSVLFLSQFQIERFTQLRSLRLIRLEIESVKRILSKLSQLKQLRSFSFDSKTIRYPDLPYRIYNQIECDILVVNAYKQVLPQLNQLHLNSGKQLTSVSLSNLHRLKLETCTFHQLQIIFQSTPRLQSLSVSMQRDKSNFDTVSTSSSLTRLHLTILGNYLHR